MNGTAAHLREGLAADSVDFESYVAARRRPLVGAAYLLTGDHHAAEDLVQSTLVRTYAAWDRIKHRTAIDAYVRRTMVNVHADWWRRAWRRLERTTETVPEPIPRTPVDQDTDLDEALWNALQALAPRERAVVALRYYEDLSEAQTAAALGCSLGTVKSTSSRALDKLRTSLGPIKARRVDVSR